MTTQETLPFGYSDKELTEFKNNIFEKLDKANDEFEHLTGLISKDDPENKFEKGQLEQILERQRTFITNLNQALLRIENKSYGICRVTGKLIDKARLLAVPHATLSVEAKMGVNKNAPDVPVIEVPKKDKKKRASKKEAEQTETVRYPDEDLRNFKTLIGNRIDSANEELKYFRIVKSDREKGIKVEGYENLSVEEVDALMDRQNSFINELESALDRVKKKTYGVCEETGELIPKQVLLQHPIIKRLKPTPERPSSTIENKTEDLNVRTCRICGCTDDDCRQCIEKTGKPCHWIDVDLCSACEEEAMKQSESEMQNAEGKSEDESLIINPANARVELSEAEKKHLAELENNQSNNDNDMNFFQQLAQAAAQNVDITLRIMQKDNKLTVNIMPGSKSVTIKPILVTGTASELDAEFFKTIAPGISEIAGIVHNIEDVKKDLESKKSQSAKPKPESPKPAATKPDKKSGIKKAAKKTPGKAEEIKPEVNSANKVESVQTEAEPKTEDIETTGAEA